MTDSFGNFTASSIISGVVFGLIGLWLFRYGKKNLRHSIMIIGICLMAYPYFVSNPVLDWGLGISLCGLAYYLW